MLQAMMHGKLTGEEEGMEDLLTSNVFGLMKYLPPDAALFPFLSMAWDPCSGRTLEDLLQGGIVLESVQFWPTISNDGCLPCEPDVDLTLRDQNGERSRIFIEAKYRSGKSSEASPSKKLPNDQLAREFDNLRAICERDRIKRFGVIYLTADYSCPFEDLKQSVEEYREKRGSDPSIYWLPWRRLVDVLSENASPGFDIHQDILELMYYLDLIRFRRLRMPNLIPPVWDFKPIYLCWEWILQEVEWEWKGKGIHWRWNVLPISQILSFR